MLMQLLATAAAASFYSRSVGANTEDAMGPVDAMGPTGAEENCTTIFDAVGSTPNLSSLAEAAMKLPDIVEVFSDPSQEFTVFAPNNDAFIAVENFTALLADDSALGSILQNHAVVQGVFTAADLMEMNGEELNTVNDAKLTVTVAAGVVTITAPNGGPVANVLTADIVACSSIVHIIDQVLVDGNPSNTTTTTTGGGSDNQNTDDDSATQTTDPENGVNSLNSGALLLAAAAMVAALI